jgi:hypothetical protein
MWWVDVGTANARGCASQTLLKLIFAQLPQLVDGGTWTAPHSHVEKEVEERERDSEYQTVKHLVPEFRAALIVLSHSISGGYRTLGRDDMQ